MHLYILYWYLFSSQLKTTSIDIDKSRKRFSNVRDYVIPPHHPRLVLKRWKVAPHNKMYKLTKIAVSRKKWKHIPRNRRWIWLPLTLTLVLWGITCFDEPLSHGCRNSDIFQFLYSLQLYSQNLFRCYRQLGSLPHCSFGISWAGQLRLGWFGAEFGSPEAETDNDDIGRWSQSAGRVDGIPAKVQRCANVMTMLSLVRSDTTWYNMLQCCHNVEGEHHITTV